MNIYQVTNPRTSSIIRSEEIKKKKVLIVGLGGGADIALHLYRSGISKLTLIDKDILEADNLVRHVCGMEYLGQNKAIATKKLLNRYCKNTEIKAFDFDVFNERVKVYELISENDLIIIATDSDASKYYLNEMAVELRKNAIYVGMYENGDGGEVFVSRPDKACFECLSRLNERNTFLKIYLEAKEKKDCASNRDAKAMPGLGIDQSFLSSIASRKAIEILTSNDETSTLKHIDGDWIIWSLCGIAGTGLESLSSIRMTLKIHNQCTNHK